METIQMQSAMTQQHHHHHHHQMPFRPTGPGPGALQPGTHCMDVNGQSRLLSNSPFPDFQLAELHQTLENLINTPNTNQNAGSAGPSYHPINNRPADNMSFLPMEQADSFRHQTQLSMNSGNNNGNSSGGHNPNKRMSVDLGCSLSDYSESWSTNSPRSNASSDESLENNSLQSQQTNAKPNVQKPTSIYPNNVKRQNIGRVPSAHQLNHSSNNQQTQPNMMPNMMMQQQTILPRQPVQHHQQQQQHHPLLHHQNSILSPPMMQGGQFLGRPRLFDFASLGHRPQLHHHNVRNPMLGLPTSPMQQQQGQRMPLPPPPMMHHNQQQIQQQNFCFTGSMGPPPGAGMSAANAAAAETAHQKEKRSRFMRTAQILEQSGLMDVTLKTAALMRENAVLQREIDILMAETRNIEHQFMATATNQNPIPQQNMYLQQHLHPGFHPQQHHDNSRMQLLVQSQMNMQQQQPLLRGTAPLQQQPQHLVLEY